jgi:GT2 family glycosyltransferase
MMDWRDLLLAVVIRAVDRIAPRFVRRKASASHALPAAHPGISILIPERGTPALLAACLASVELACKSLREPTAVHVVVNGCDPADYDDLVLKHRFVSWHFEARALGFHSAIRRGLGFVTHQWVYLLNSDMTMAQDALATLSPLRDGRTFAIASQIFFSDQGRRREETGWTDYWIDAAITQHFDRTPEGPFVRGHLYASGGASLFRAALLRRYVSSTSCYSPFYFEDADWGVQAARSGYAVKFCPGSTVMHAHRATIKRFYAPQEIARVIRRNQLLFEARHGLGGRARMLASEAPQTRRELTSPAVLIGIVLQRWHSCQARLRGFSPARSCATAYPRSFVASYPTVMIYLEGGARNGWQHAVNDARWMISRTASSANVVLIAEGIRAESIDLAREPLSLCAAIHVLPSVEASKQAHVLDQNSSRQQEWWRSVYGTGAMVSEAQQHGVARVIQRAKLPTETRIDQAAITEVSDKLVAATGSSIASAEHRSLR